MDFEPIIGLEVHIELKTLSKMFCGCPADYFGREPNSQTCPVCLGLPGALPVPNRKAVAWTVLLAKALGCRVNPDSKFYRKNYFYPDLPKGYQISQYDEPIGLDGQLKFKCVSDKEPEVREKLVGIRRVHLEEDTGKLLHEMVDGEDCTLVDFNRSGVPLIEVVTEPDLRGDEEAKAFLKEVQKIVRYLQISDADMEKGTMRLEPSISLRLCGQIDLPSYRVELKNINSFRFVQKALEYEINRQGELLTSGRGVAQETRGWDESKGVTVYQRSKEEAQDYRYFPEPDIPPLHFDAAFVESITQSLPELPREKTDRFVQQYQIRYSDAEILCEDRGVADLFEGLVKRLTDSGISEQKLANLMVNKKVTIEGRGVDEVLAQILDLLKPSDGVASEIVKEACQKVLAENPMVVVDYQGGKVAALDFLVGQALKQLKTSGRANPIKVRQILTELMSHG